jgi:hypothetical protein
MKLSIPEAGMWNIMIDKTDSYVIKHIGIYVFI